MADFGGRLRSAWRAFEDREDRKLTQGEVADLVTRALGRARPFRQATVSEWYWGRRPDDVETMEALAMVLGADPRTLVFGEDEDVRSRADQLRAMLGETRGEPQAARPSAAPVDADDVAIRLRAAQMHMAAERGEPMPGDVAPAAHPSPRRAPKPKRRHAG